ncbi:MAG TPA: class F sortase [Dehalococcoidia bacterium]|nr:class F sortase [Dehalococcoidia bacterium]
MVIERIRSIWEAASPRKRAGMVAAPIVLVLAVAGGIAGAVAAGGGSGSAEEARASMTDTATTEPTATLTPMPTETPASAGLQDTNGAGGGGGTSGNYQRVQPRSGSGPGAPQGTGMTLSIPSIGVNASVYSRTVGTNGVMGNPSGAWDVIWYDFSAFGPGLGGYPGEPGANAVFAGHVDYIHVGPAVFWSLRDLGPGSQVTVNTPNGPVTYAIQWSEWAPPDADFGQFVAKTGQDSITLVTCIGDFSNGHYSNRLIVRGVRI